MAASILITGASSGIGRALADVYAGPGVTLFLGGRNAEALAETADLCRVKGACVAPRATDVTDRATMADWVAAADAAAPLDLVIANAGITGGDDLADTDAIFDVNLRGLVNTALPAIATMRKRGRGALALMSSLYGLRPQGHMPAYSASKAAVRVWGAALRLRLRDEGIVVSVITPGFVRTRLTEGLPRPLLPADRAAAIIRRGLDRQSPEIAFPAGEHLIMRLKNLVPRCLVAR